MHEIFGSKPWIEPQATAGSNVSITKGGLRLDTNRLDTSHSQRLNSGKLLGTGRCGWWCSIEPCPNGTLPLQM